MIIIRTFINVLPEKQKEVLQTLLSLIKPSGKEIGCLSYAIFRDIEDKNSFNLISEWSTREDLDRHIKSDRFGVMLGIRSLLREPPSIRIHKVSNSEGMEMVEAIRNKSTLVFSV